MLWNTSEDKMIDGFVLAIQFLTKLPIKKQVDFNHKNLAASTFFYPLVGMIVGAIGWLFHYIFSYLNRDVGSLLALVALIFVTGGLHLDGLSDTCDGFLSYRDKEKVLEIMKDSRTGAFGVIAIVLDILVKYVLIKSIDKNMLLALMLSYGNSRLIICYLMSTKKVARKGGLGDMFHGSNPKGYALAGGIVYLILILMIDPIFLLPLVVNFLLGQAMTLVTYRKIDGFTGDVYGACIELGEIASLLAFLGVFKWI